MMKKEKNYNGRMLKAKAIFALAAAYDHIW